jgi:uncharacterized protein YbaR (Trm112 family)
LALDERLLSILACPEDKGPLYYFEAGEFLYNPRLRLKYLIKDNIPIMLVDQAINVSEEDHEQLMKRIQQENIRKTFEE